MAAQSIRTRHAAYGLKVPLILGILSASALTPSCKESGSAAGGDRSGNPLVLGSSAATTTPQAVGSATQRTSSASGATPAPTAFGPDISKAAVEAVNANTAYDTNQPQYALDGKPVTAWSAPADSRPWLEISLLPGTKVDGIEIAGQRADTKTKNYWTRDSVIKRARIVWDGGEGEVTFARAIDKGVKKRLPIGAVTRRVRIEIVETERGEQSNDIDIDEIGIFGAGPASSPPDPKGLTGLCRAGRTAVRFNRGTVVGGEWTDGPDAAWRWTFFPITVRVDDNEWHTLGVRYAEDTEMLDDGSKNVKSRNAGKLFRFRATADGFEADQNGEQGTGKCSAK